VVFDLAVHDGRGCVVIAVTGKSRECRQRTGLAEHRPTPGTLTKLFERPIGHEPQPDTASVKDRTPPKAAGHIGDDTQLGAGNQRLDENFIHKARRLRRDLSPKLAAGWAVAKRFKAPSVAPQRHAHSRII